MVKTRPYLEHTNYFTHSMENSMDIHLSESKVVGQASLHSAQKLERGKGLKYLLVEALVID